MYMNLGELSNCKILPLASAFTSCKPFPSAKQKFDWNRNADADAALFSKRVLFTLLFVKVKEHDHGLKQLLEQLLMRILNHWE